MAVSSLVPGILFRTTGLNASSTPTEITAGPDQVKTKYRRSSIPEGKWPPESPVARVYDVRNSSSQLILLNNRMDKKSHLRVQSGRYKTSDSSDDGRLPKPERHEPPFTSPTNPSKHKKCHDSTTPVYTPTPSQAPYELGRFSTKRSRANRCPQPSGDGHQVKEWHHYSSQVDSRRRAMSAPPNRSCGTPRTRNSRELIPPPSFSRDKDWLQHPDMTRGQMRYANSIAKVYDMTNMKQLKQAQYIQLIYREQQRGFFTPENYSKYLIYLNSERKRQFGVSAPPSAISLSDKTPRRAKSSQSRTQEPTASRFLKKKSSNRTSSDNQQSQLSSDSESSSRSTEQRSSTSDNISDSDKENKGKLPANTKQKGQEDSLDSKAEKRVLRPKSSKFRYRDEKSPPKQSYPHRRSVSPSSISSSSSSNSSKKNNSKEEEQYWRQPSPPPKEIEPDGRGVVMTGGNMNMNGETLEVASTEVQENDTKKQRKPTATAKGDDKLDKTFLDLQDSTCHEQETDNIDTADTGVRTYDIETEDGKKTRVYQQSDMHTAPSDSILDDTPVDKQTEQ